MLWAHPTASPGIVNGMPLGNLHYIKMSLEKCLRVFQRPQKQRYLRHCVR